MSTVFLRVGAGELPRGLQPRTERLTRKQRYFHQNVTSPLNCQLVTNPSFQDHAHASLGSVTRSTAKRPIVNHATGVSKALMCRVQSDSHWNCGVDPMWPTHCDCQGPSVKGPVWQSFQETDSPPTANVLGSSQPWRMAAALASGAAARAELPITARWSAAINPPTARTPLAFAGRPPPRP